MSRSPDPKKAKTAFDSVHLHGWGIWTALTTETNQVLNGQKVRVFETWYTPDDLPSAGGQMSRLKAIQRGRSTPKPFHQFERVHPARSKFLAAGPTIGRVAGFVKYDPGAAEHIVTQGRYTLRDPNASDALARTAPKASTEDGVMMTPTRIVRMIGIAGLVGWMGMVGWVAKTTQAQNGGQNPAPLPPAATMPDESAQGGARNAQGAEQRRPGTPADRTRFGSLLGSRDSLRLPRCPRPEASRGERVTVSSARPGYLAPTQQSSAASEPAGIRTLTENQPAPSSDDPEQSAQSFVQRNQKEAEDHLRALTAEAQQLRARLAKLESGIKKWQCLVNALKSSQGQPITSTANAPGAEDAGDLEPIKPSQAGGARVDKRVKWATATSAATGAGAQPAPAADPPQQLPAAQPPQVVVPGSVPR